MTQSPRYGEVWTKKSDGSPLTFVGLNPETSAWGVWIAADGMAITFPIDRVNPPDLFPFKSGDVIKHANVPHLYVVVDPQPDDESFFRATVIEWNRYEQQYQIDHLLVAKPGPWVKQ